MTIAKIKDFVFVSYRSARRTARKYGISQISKTTVQCLNLFLDEIIYIMVQASTNHRLDHINLPVILRRLCPYGSVAVNAIADGENFLSQVSLKNSPRDFPQGQLPLATIVERIRAQCSIYSTMGSSCIIISKEHSLVTSQTAAFLCGVLEYIATFLIVDTILLARNNHLLYVDSKTFERAIEVNREIRGIYNKTNLAHSMETKRAERFGPKCERSVVSSLDAQEVDNLSDFDYDDELSFHSFDESPYRDRGTLAKFFGGFKSNRSKGIYISHIFPLPYSYTKEFKINGRLSLKVIASEPFDSNVSALGFQMVEQNRIKFDGSLLINQEKAKSFEALINSTETLKMSLTSSRLQTIEVKSLSRPRLVPRDERNFHS